MSTIEELAAEVALLRTQVPTIEDLLFSVAFPCWNTSTSITTANRLTLMVAPIPVRILSVVMSYEYSGVPSSSTNYWTGIIEKGTGAAGYPDVAVRSTRSTGADANGPIVSDQAWSWDAAVWGNADLAVGEMLTVNWVPTGSPAALDFPQVYTIRYRPL